MHIAVLGGTFNPVHNGHLLGAEAAREAISPERFLFMPTYIAPHKAGEADVGVDARLEMLSIALAGTGGFEISELEIRRGGRSFTVDTVRELLAMDEGVRVSLVIGSDSFNEIATWHDYVEILRLASLVVMPRSGHPAHTPAEALPVELAEEFCYDIGCESYRDSRGNSITFLAQELPDISSTKVRELIAGGKSVEGLVPPGVLDYIEEHGLYRP